MIGNKKNTPTNSQLSLQNPTSDLNPHATPLNPTTHTQTKAIKIMFNCYNFRFKHPLRGAVEYSRPGLLRDGKHRSVCSTQLPLTSSITALRPLSLGRLRLPYSSKFPP